LRPQSSLRRLRKPICVARKLLKRRIILSAKPVPTSPDHAY